MTKTDIELVLSAAPGAADVGRDAAKTVQLHWNESVKATCTHARLQTSQCPVYGGDDDDDRTQVCSVKLFRALG